MQSCWPRAQAGTSRPLEDLIAKSGCKYGQKRASNQLIRIDGKIMMVAMVAMVAMMVAMMVNTQHPMYREDMGERAATFGR